MPPELVSIDILKPLKDFMSWLVSQMLIFITNIANILNETVIKPIVSALNWIISKVVDAVKGVFTNIINFIKGYGAPIVPERALELGLTLVGLAGAGALGIGVLLSALNVKLLGFGIDVEPLAKFTSQLFNVRLITGIVIGALLYSALRVPLRYYANKLFRPFKPDIVTLFGLYTRGYISRETLKSELAYVTGFNDVYINGLIDILEYNPSLFDLLRMADYVELSDEFIKKSLKILGVKEPYFSVLYTLIKRRPIREELRANVNFLVYLYQNGFISKEFLVSALDKLGLQEREKELMLMLADNKRTFELIERKVKMLRTSFIKGFISEATLVSELEKLKLDKEFINIIVSDAKLYAKVEVPVPKITRGFAIDLPITVSYSYTIS